MQLTRRIETFHSLVDVEPLQYPLAHGRAPFCDCCCGFSKLGLEIGVFDAKTHSNVVCSIASRLRGIITTSVLIGHSSTSELLDLHAVASFVLVYCLLLGLQNCSQRNHLCAN